jgi:ribosomal protein S12 methylthiotransferase
MTQLLIGSDYQMTEKPENAELIIVNTCGFIDTAKTESLQLLSELAGEKRPDQYLIATGCLTQRYGNEVANKIPGIDGILGTRRWMDIVEVVDKLRGKKHPLPIYHIPDTLDVGRDDAGVMRYSIQGKSAYIKIADGCRRPCAFCAIPLIKGTTVSRPAESILQEAQTLQEIGIHEIILIAQDTTDYGHDLGIKNGLANLLRQLVQAVPEVDWIRVMYAYPGYVTDELIDVMASHSQILSYLDMPLQHAHPAVLKRMRRPANTDWVYRTLDKIRLKMPNIALRTTFIVGFPGETEEEFQTLLDFIKNIQFDKVGAFQYSYEEGTPAESLGDPVPAQIKQERWARLMELQQRISLERNQELVGSTLDVLIEGSGDGISLGRSYRDAPEIDGLVIIESADPIGEMVPVRITGAMAYDLTGIVVQPNSN